MGVVDRVKNICLTPATEWPVIASETAPNSTIVTGYLLPLAAVGAVAGFIGGSVVGRTLPFLGTYRVPFAAGLAGALVTIVMTVVCVFVIAAIVNALAPKFGATKDSAQAFKIVAYSATPGLAAGVLQVLPALSILVALAGLYGIYIMYLGLPRLMRCPSDKAVGYTATVVLCGIVVAIVFGMVAAAVTGVGSMMGMGGFGLGAPAAVQADPDTPLGRLEQMGRAMEESAKRAEEAAGRGDTGAAASEAIGSLGALLGGGTRVEPLAADQLRAFMPETFAGLSRRSSSAERTEFGLAVSRAEGRFGDGTAADVTVEVVDTGGLAGLMGMAAWMNVQNEREDDDGYERTRREGNRMVHEKSSRSGDSEFAMVVGERFMVSAKGRGLDVNQLRTGVSGLDLSRLESMSSTAGGQ